MDGEGLDEELAGAIDAGAQKVSADAAIVLSAGRDVEVEIGGAVLLGDIAGQVGDFHLFGKGLVHILLGRRVEKAEGRLADGSEAGDAAGEDVFFQAEGGERLRDFDMVVKAQDKFPSGDFLAGVHGVSVEKWIKGSDTGR